MQIEALTRQANDLLRSGEIASIELQESLGESFGSAQMTSFTRVISFPSGDDPQLRVAYSGKYIPKLEVIEETEQVTNAIESVLRLRDSQSKRVGRINLMAGRPVAGTFAYGDDLRIGPVSEDSPRPPIDYSPIHPFVAEFNFEASHSEQVNAGRMMRGMKRVELLLAGLTCNDVHRLDTHNASWYYPKSSESLNLSPEYGQPGYTGTARNNGGEEFSDWNDQDELELVEDPFETLRGTQSFQLPRGINKMLDGYFLSDLAEQKRIMRSCFWIQSALRGWEVARSFMLLAAVQAVESLTENQPVEKCNECKQDVYNSKRQGYKDFVQRYAPGFSDKQLLDVYDLRSSVTHGSELLTYDADVAFGYLHPGDHRELVDIARRVAQRSLMSYLHEKDLSQKT